MDGKISDAITALGISLAVGGAFLVLTELWLFGVITLAIGIALEIIASLRRGYGR